VVQLKTWPVGSYIGWIWMVSVQLSPKLSGGSWKTSTGEVFHSLIALGKKVLLSMLVKVLHWTCL